MGLLVSPSPLLIHCFASLPCSYTLPTLASNKSSSNNGGQQRGRPGYHDEVPEVDTIPVTVPVVDFAKFMARVAQRFIPPSDDLTFPPAVVMKMDVRMPRRNALSPDLTIKQCFTRMALPTQIIKIEGGEYATLTHAFVSGALCHLRAFTLEWHDRFCDAPFCGVTRCLEQHFQRLTYLCDTELILYDDESYVDDPLEAEYLPGGENRRHLLGRRHLRGDRKNASDVSDWRPYSSGSTAELRTDA